MSALMQVRRIAEAGVTHPFGDARTVQQAFPSGVSEHEADPFLMCDYFNSVNKDEANDDPDHFPVGWHPHRGFDIASYLKSGVGRHGDSLGNRETYATPGMQWMNTGSGVEHAEGGANPKGQRVEGFQIWINVPKEHKMDDPDYGTVSPDELPTLTVSEGVSSRVLAGNMFDQMGPFRTKQSVQMADLEVAAGQTVETSIAGDLDTALLYVYQGNLTRINDEEKLIPEQSVILLDASDSAKRGLSLTAGDDADVMLFAGKKLKEPIAWHGPIVMNTQDELLETFQDLRAGKFPPVRVDWDYKHLASKTKSKGNL